MSAATASPAAFLISSGAGKSGNPCARFTAPYVMACRVISRITDSVKCETLSLRNCFVWEEVCGEDGGLADERFPFLILTDRVAMKSRLAQREWAGGKDRGAG